MKRRSFCSTSETCLVFRIQYKAKKRKVFIDHNNNFTFKCKYSLKDNCETDSFATTQKPDVHDTWGKKEKKGISLRHSGFIILGLAELLLNKILILCTGVRRKAMF